MSESKFIPVKDWAEKNRILRTSAVNLCRTGRLGDSAKREIVRTRKSVDRLTLNGEVVESGTSTEISNVRWFVREDVTARKVAKKNNGKEFERWEIK